MERNTDYEGMFNAITIRLNEEAFNLKKRMLNKDLKREDWTEEKQILTGIEFAMEVIKTERINDKYR